MKSPETTISILVMIFFALLIFAAMAGEQMTHDCRLEAMKAKYPAIEIQGICK